MIALTGAAVSIALFLVASWHNPLMLKILIGAWVVAPYIGSVAAKRIFPRAARAIDKAIVIATVISVAVYSYSIFLHPGWKPAAPFVVVPVLAWILVIAAAIIAR